DRQERSYRAAGGTEHPRGSPDLAIWLRDGDWADSPSGLERRVGTKSHGSRSLSGRSLNRSPFDDSEVGAHRGDREWPAHAREWGLKHRTVSQQRPCPPAHHLSRRGFIRGVPTDASDGPGAALGVKRWPLGVQTLRAKHFV